ncbi:hypothetical protein GCM10023324_15380 [Streptomyces youssoufiensis]
MTKLSRNRGIGAVSRPQARLAIRDDRPSVPAPRDVAVIQSRAEPARTVKWCGSVQDRTR